MNNLLNIDSNKYYLFYLISVLLGIYVVYMLKFFETKKSFHYGNIVLHIQKLFNIKEILDHPLEDSPVDINHVCPLGHFAAVLLFIFLVIRFPLAHYLHLNFNIDSLSYLYKISLIILIIMFISSFMNLNVTVYLIPYFIIETLILYNL